jgi:hypothetical protein
LKAVKSEKGGGSQFFVWRFDMPELYLSLLRKKVVGVLEEVVRIGRGGHGSFGKEGGKKVVVRSRVFTGVGLGNGANCNVVDSNEAERETISKHQFESSAEGKARRGVALLWIGNGSFSGRGGTSDKVSKESTIFHNASVRLPVFDLPRLLGEEAMNGLRKNMPTIFGFPEPESPSEAGDVGGSGEGSADATFEGEDKGNATMETKPGNFVVLKTPNPKVCSKPGQVDRRTELVIEAVSWLWRLEGYVDGWEALEIDENADGEEVE